MLLTGFVLMLPAVYLPGRILSGPLIYEWNLLDQSWNSDYMLLALLLLPYYIKCVRKAGPAVCCPYAFIWMLYLAILYVPYGAFYALYPCASD
ncbi:MAG: hypothetical protein ACLTBV_29065 [Enterocloster bolteae]